MRKKKKTGILILLAAGLLLLLYFSITFEITVQSVGAGKISCSRSRVHFLQSATIYIYPDQSLPTAHLAHLYINNREYKRAVRMYQIPIRCIWRDVAVFAEFADADTTVVPANAPQFVRLAVGSAKPPPKRYADC